MKVPAKADMAGAGISLARLGQESGIRTERLKSDTEYGVLVTVSFVQAAECVDST